jgi:hypothetical protein
MTLQSAAIGPALVWTSYDLVRKYFRQRVGLLERNCGRCHSVQSETLERNLGVEEAILDADQVAEFVVLLLLER